MVSAMRKTIFIGTGVTKWDLGDGLRCEFADGTLKVYQGEALLSEKPAELWDGFELIPTKQGVHVTPVTPPRKDGEALLWLMGLGKHQRAESEEGYQKIITDAKKKAEPREKSEMICDHVQIMQFTYEEGTRNVAGYIHVEEGELSKFEILLLVPYMTAYPEEYTKKVLLTRFGITAQEFHMARQY